MATIDDEELRGVLLRQLDRWSSLGRRTTPTGAVQVARVPHVAPLAWLHDVFPRITDEQQRELLDNCSNYAASSLREVHKQFNGVNLFSSNFFLFGRRGGYGRSLDNVQPWDLSRSNDEVSRLLRKGSLLVGGSNALPQGISFIETSNRSVIAVRKENFSEVLFEWTSLKVCILSELKRLSFLFDDQGRATDKVALTQFDLKLK